MKDLPIIRCGQKCKRTSDCHFGIIGECYEEIKILFVLNHPDSRINQKSLFDNSYETTLFGNIRTGQILSELLNYCELNREDIVITNLFKGILQERNSPSTKEYEKCLETLLKQIEILSPRRIIVFGQKGKELLKNTQNCYFSKHPSKIWTETINPDPVVRQDYYKPIKEFLID